MKMEKRSGFTLIELLVVITIISILTIIAVSQFNTAKIKARDTQRKADLDSVSKAVNMYYTDYGEFPAQGAFTWGDEFVDDDYYYMKVVPSENRDDFDQYCYLPNTDLTSYVIFGNMEGVGMTIGDYTTNGSVCGDGVQAEYNFGLAAPNESVTSFCLSHANCN